MAQLRRLGEVSAVSVTCQTAQVTASSLSEVRFRLQVWSCSRFLHPASFYSIVDSEHSGSYMLYLRYKDLAAIHKQLLWLYKSLMLPSFPPKKWIVINSEAFLNQRAAMLDEYFAELLKIGEVRRSQVLLEALAPPTVLALKVMGQRGSGKGKFIRRFLHYSPVTGVSSTSQNSPAEGEISNPVDVIVDGKTVRIASVEFMTLREGEACPWYLASVKHLELIVIAKSLSPGSNIFSECRCSQPTDPSDQCKSAYDTVCSVLREYLKRVS